MENLKTVHLPLWEVGLVIVATFFVTIFLGAAILLLFGDAITLIAGELLVLIVPLIYLISKRVNVKDYVRINLNPKYIGIGLACGLFLLIVNIFVSGALTTIFGESTAVQQSNQLVTNLATTPWGLTAVAISLALAGICEEFAFRGFLQNSIFKTLKNSKYAKFSAIISIVFSATVFGLFHFDPQGVYTLSALASGCVLGYFYYRWNYIVSATAHASMNIIVLIFLLLSLGV